MKIDELPVELLIKIFSFLPVYDEVSLVNKLFYDIACKVTDPNICLCITRKTYPQCLQSMLTSNRNISKVEISTNDKGLRPLISIVERFSATIKVLKLMYVYGMDESTFLEALSLTPNLEYLELIGCEFKDQEDEKDQPAKKTRYKDVYLNVTKLKSLSVCRCGVDILNDFFRLPTGVLENLQIDNFHWNTMALMISRQPNIKRLCLSYEEKDDGNVLSTDIFDKLKLESLKLLRCKINSVTIADIVSKQTATQLKSLYISRDIIVDDRIMNAVTDLLELEELTVGVAKTPVESFVKIRKLKKLKDLTIVGMRIEVATAFAQLDNASIEKLILNWCAEMPTHVIASLAKSVPHLKQFKYSLPNQLTFAQVDAIMRHFNFVETLGIPISDRLLLDQGDYSNPKLSELSILVQHYVYEPWLTKLMAAYPNLKKFSLIVEGFSGCLEYSPQLQICPILNGFSKLESLVLRAIPETFEGTTIVDLDCLPDHKNNLKFVSLGRQYEAEKIVKKLRPRFGVAAKVGGPCEYLNLAVNRYTMHRETEIYEH